MGKSFSMRKLDEYFSNLPEPPEVVSLDVSPEASFGLITDVQQVLRKNEAFRIRYKTTRSDSDTLSAYDPDRLAENLQNYSDIYMNLPPTDVNELEDVYSKLMQTFDTLKTSLKQIPNSPPPPPIPPYPQKRMDLEMNEPNKLQPPAPPPPVETRNLMRIRISPDGTVFMNDNPVPKNDIISLLTDFLENPGNDSKLSESPKEAVISISTMQDTPYSRYIETLDHIMLTYDKLRVKAAVERFGVSYSALPEGGDQKQEIDSTYPKRISIAEPKE